MYLQRKKCIYLQIFFNVSMEIRINVPTKILMYLQRYKSTYGYFNARIYGDMNISTEIKMYQCLYEYIYEEITVML